MYLKFSRSFGGCSSSNNTKLCCGCYFWLLMILLLANQVTGINIRRTTTEATAKAIVAQEARRRGSYFISKRTHRSHPFNHSYTYKPSANRKGSLAFSSSSIHRRGCATNIIPINNSARFSFGIDHRRSMTSSATSASAETAGVGVVSNLQSVRDNIKECVKNEKKEDRDYSVRLVAVSKTKPIPLLMDAYNEPCNHRIFGENYAQELVEKASTMPKDIKWHFIGPLQSNKANMLVKTFISEDVGNNIDMLAIETVASMKLARKLNNAIETIKKDSNLSDGDGSPKKLEIYIQINTSGEETKSGLRYPDDKSSIVELCDYICSDECKDNLKLKGFMTIGSPGNTDEFDLLVTCRDDIMSSLSERNDNDGGEVLELSMGMSNDYINAIKHGSTSVRVGSTIFGQRDYSNLSKK